jgi:hypothetical protein
MPFPLQCWYLEYIKCQYNKTPCENPVVAGCTCKFLCEAHKNLHMHDTTDILARVLQMKSTRAKEVQVCCYFFYYKKMY